MALIVLAAFADGVIGQCIAPGESHHALSGFIVILGAHLSFLWYYYDSAQIGFKRPPPLDVAIVLLGIVALPYYFFKTRGLKMGLVFNFAFVLAIYLWSVVEYSGSYFVYILQR